VTRTEETSVWSLKSVANSPANWPAATSPMEIDVIFLSKHGYNISQDADDGPIRRNALLMKTSS
jgi:hypothetical protein